MLQGIHADYAEVVESTTRRTRSLVQRRFNDPVPRHQPLPPPLRNWGVERSFVCPPIAPPPEVMFGRVLEDRRTIRAISLAPFREVLNAIAYATRPRFTRENDRYGRSLRPSISAGALHPVELLLHHPVGSPRIYHYCPRTHRLNRLAVHNVLELQNVRRDCELMLPDCAGTLVLFVGQPGSVQAHYENHISLFWRDAGALLQTLGFVCTAY